MRWFVLLTNQKIIWTYGIWRILLQAVLQPLQTQTICNRLVSGRRVLPNNVTCPDHWGRLSCHGATTHKGPAIWRLKKVACRRYRHWCGRFEEVVLQTHLELHAHEWFRVWFKLWNYIWKDWTLIHSENFTLIPVLILHCCFLNKPNVYWFFY